MPTSLILALFSKFYYNIVQGKYNYISIKWSKKKVVTLLILSVGWLIEELSIQKLLFYLQTSKKKKKKKRFCFHTTSLGYPTLYFWFKLTTIWKSLRLTRIYCFTLTNSKVFIFCKADVLYIHTYKYITVFSCITHQRNEPL